MFKFNQLSSLNGEPKVFLIVDCRGDVLEEKDEIAYYSVLGKLSLQQTAESESIPKPADIFVGYVTVLGDTAFRETTD